MEYIVRDFFDKRIESDINEKLFYRNYLLDDSYMADYISQLISTPMTSFIDYILVHCSISYITFSDVVQFSSLEDATTGICIVLSESCEGMHNIDVGRKLMNDGKERKDGALRKYGENHAKTAIELGLVQENCGSYYLSCLGEYFNRLSNERQYELLRRTILRNRYFQRLLIKAQDGPVSLLGEMSFFAGSTQKRRLPNVKALYNILIGDGKDIAPFIKNISIQ